MTKDAIYNLKSAIYALVAAVLLVGNCASVNAQSLRSPLIQGAPSAAAGEAPMEGAAPPVGSGSTPMPVTPGMTGGPIAPASYVPMPLFGALDRGPGGAVNSYLAPYLQPPPSTQGADPGMLPLNNSGSSAAIETNINPGGGMPGDCAPQSRYGRQTSRDFGLKRTGSSLTDFGEALSAKQTKVQPQVSQDGPRSMQSYQGDAGGVRSPNLAGAQQTQSLYGNRTLFKGANLRARATIADH